MNRRATLAMLALPALARAQLTRPVRLVVPFPPGGSNDVIARPLADKLASRLGQPVVVENRPGAGGSIGAGQVAQSAADGTTLMVTSSSFAASAVVQRTPYDAQTSFEAVALLARSPFLVLTTLDFPARDLASLLALARARPGSIDFGSSGPGGINHFVTEYFALQAGLRLNHVPYRGMPPAVTDLVAGHIQLLITTMASASGPIRDGRVRLLAYTAPGAPDSNPAAPIVRSTGLDYEASIWWGLLAPRGLPPTISALLQAAIRDALSEPDIARVYEAEGARPSFASGAEFQSELARDITRFRDVATRANIRAE